MDEDINNARIIHFQTFVSQDWQQCKVIAGFWHFQYIHFSNNVFDINSRNQMRKVRKVYQRVSRIMRVLLLQLNLFLTNKSDWERKYTGL